MDESKQEFSNGAEQPLISVVDCLPNISCTTFNILAPIYKRLNCESRESEFRELWVSRNMEILDRLRQLRSSIICLQEVWVDNEELVWMYEKQLGDAGYMTYKLARTNNRGDGLLTALNRNIFHVLSYKELLFNDGSDRVAQLLHVELSVPFYQDQFADVGKEALLVNTHLIFPHNSDYCYLRLQQVYRILRYLDLYRDECQLRPVPIILCGDWNGSKKGHVYKYLRAQGFVSCYDIAHHYKDGDGDSNKWISHRNHRGNVCGVDFVWLLNPNKCRKSPKENFMKAVLGNIKYLLHRMSTELVDPQLFTPNDGSCITYSQFSQALNQIGLCGLPHAFLSSKDINDLWEYLDSDRNGVIDLSHFAGAGNLDPLLQQNEGNIADMKQNVEKSTSVMSTGLNIRKASFFPPEVEKGIWPEYYSLSDHAYLTVEFVPVTMCCPNLNGDA